MLDDDADDIHPLFHGAPTTPEFRKLRKRIVQSVREAIETYGTRGGKALHVSFNGERVRFQHVVQYLLDTVYLFICYII